MTVQNALGDRLQVADHADLKIGGAAERHEVADVVAPEPLDGDLMPGEPAGDGGVASVRLQAQGLRDVRGSRSACT